MSVCVCVCCGMRVCDLCAIIWCLCLAQWLLQDQKSQELTNSRLKFDAFSNIQWQSSPLRLIFIRQDTRHRIRFIHNSCPSQFETFTIVPSIRNVILIIDSSTSSPRIPSRHSGSLGIRILPSSNKCFPFDSLLSQRRESHSGMHFAQSSIAGLTERSSGCVAAISSKMSFQLESNAITGPLWHMWPSHCRTYLYYSIPFSLVNFVNDWLAGAVPPLIVNINGCLFRFSLIFFSLLFSKAKII